MEVKTYTKEGIKFIEINNDVNFKVQLTDLGASIYSIYFDNKIMTLTTNNLDYFKSLGCYHGKTIGAIGNRVEDGKVTINGQVYQMDQNEGPNCLHGGKNALSNQYFRYKIDEQDDYVQVIFTYNKKDLEDGLPGNINFAIIYTIERENAQIRVDFKALSDKDTLIGLTNHSYFCLGDETLKDIVFKCDTIAYLETRSTDLICLSEKPIIPIFDFRNGKTILEQTNDPFIKNHRSNGYDIHLELGENKEISLNNGKYTLLINSPFSGTQIYGDNFEDNIDFINGNKHQYRGLAVEPQDSLLNRVLLKANHIYERYITYSFSKN